MHHLLECQLHRCRRRDGSIDLEQLIGVVDRAYSQADEDRIRSERVNALMIEETEAANREREAMLEKLQHEHLKLDIALENMAHGLGMFDAEGALIFANRRFSHAFCPEGEAPIQSYAEGLARLAPYIAGYDRALDTIPVGMAAGNPTDRTVHLKDGRVAFVTFQPLPQGGWVQVQRDITEQRRADEKIQYLARHDALTGLCNRVVFNEVIAGELVRTRPNEALAVLCLDLDHFKGVNDTLGHPVGDTLLRQVADRLRLATQAEHDMIARLGGDEFAILQAGLDQPVAAEALAKRLNEEMARPFDVDGHHVVVGASIGIALAPADGSDAETLMRNADIALYRAKADGRGIHCFFEAGMDEAMQTRRRLELDLRRALADGEFELFYQPLIDLRSREIHSCEALIRWNHPTRGRVAPDAFIPIAEEIGLIVEIGEWALKQACSEAMKWPSEIGVAVNVSPIQFASPRIVNAVRRVLAETGLPAARLELEITESVLLNDTDRTLAMLHELRNLGVRIAMDDFGTGYSSLSYLRRFPFDKLKIDRSFIGDLPRDAEASAIVRAVIQLANTLGMSTTAEGVEHQDQRDLLQALNCREIQGYLISRPMESRRILDLFYPPDTTSAVA